MFVWRKEKRMKALLLLCAAIVLVCAMVLIVAGTVCLVKVMLEDV